MSDSGTICNLQPGDLVARVDTLCFTSKRPPEEVLGLTMAAVESPGYTLMKRGVNGYHKGALGLYGVMVCWTPGRADTFVKIPGQACGVVDLSVLLALGMALEAKVTRLDVAVDGGSFSPLEVYQAWQAGNVSTKVNVDGWRSHEWRSSKSGDTFYLGSPSSDRRSRCYTKVNDASRLYEDGTPITRWEVQYRNGRSMNVWLQLLQLYDVGQLDRLGELALGLISDHVRFCDASQDANISRCDTLPFWEAFVGGVQRVKTWVPQALADSLEHVEAWLHKQVAPSLAACVEHVRLSGRDVYSWLHRVIDEGVERLSPRHKHLLTVRYGEAFAAV